MRLTAVALLLAASLAAYGQSPATSAPTPPSETDLSTLVARITAREAAFVKTLSGYQPRIETYIQEMVPSADYGSVPTNDHYFMGVLDLSHGFGEAQFRTADGKIYRPSRDPFAKFHALQYIPSGFVGMVSPDQGNFTPDNYEFSFAGTQFLGAVRCLMFDVQPRPHARGKVKFIGRIWVEDQDDNIVRFDGTFEPQPRFIRLFHFDSWRQNMAPGLWLPVSIYIEQSDINLLVDHVSLKGETRFWGYNLKAANAATVMTDVQVTSPAQVQDQSQTAHDVSPLGAERAWEEKAEQDVLVRMQQAGLLSPPGPVDAVLEQVVNNLEVTNSLDIEPPVHCRVLLTTPLESFNVGHTIVVSRGLIDVLPDEASLAMILAHELGHIVLNQGINTAYAFDDRMIFSDTLTFEKLRLGHSPEEEAAADAKGIELLRNSPYKNQLAQAALFLEAVQRQSHTLPNLLSPHLGNPLTIGGRVQRMHALLAEAPELQARNLQQVPALPLAGRVDLNPWNDQLTLSHAPAVALLSPRDKLLFEITPYDPYLTRVASSTAAAPSNGQ